MDLAHFIQNHRPDWRRSRTISNRSREAACARWTTSKPLSSAGSIARAASDLNQAQTFVSGDATVQYLNDLVARCYLVIHARTRTDVRGTLRYFLWSYPAVFRQSLRYFLLAAAFCAAGTLFGLLASTFDPQAARAHLLPHDFPMIQPTDEADAMNEPAQSTGVLALDPRFCSATTPA